jgi:hypothetical protein
MLCKLIQLRWMSCCLLALPIGKRLGICAGFGLGDKILAHPLANVGMTSVHRMKIFRWMQFFTFWLSLG